MSVKRNAVDSRQQHRVAADGELEKLAASGADEFRWGDLAPRHRQRQKDCQQQRDRGGKSEQATDYAVVSAPHSGQRPWMHANRTRT